MTIILFLIDTSSSMNQRTYIGTSLIDVAKAAVETFMKVNTFTTPLNSFQNSTYFYSLLFRHFIDEKKTKINCICFKLFLIFFLSHHKTKTSFLATSFITFATLKFAQHIFLCCHISFFYHYYV